MEPCSDQEQNQRLHNPSVIEARKQNKKAFKVLETRTSQSEPTDQSQVPPHVHKEVLM